MPTEYPGDATEEDIKNQLHRDLRGQLTGVTGTDTRQVTVDAATAALLLELLPEPPPEEEKEPKKLMSANAPVQAGKAKESREQLEAKTKEQLIEQADDEDIEVSTSWTKAQIIDALLGK